jgi:arylsulfatase A-like enzyme
MGIRKTVLGLAVVGMTAGLLGIPDARAASEKEKPNILFIFADDLSYETIGAYGMLDIDTPNLDKLVERGTSFTHAYNMGAYSGAVCAASRAMLNSGRSVWNTVSHPMDQDMKAGRMWSQLMKTSGYRTYMTGKWHVRIPAEDVFDVAVDVRGGMPKQTSEGYGRPKDEQDYANGWKPWETQYGGFWEGGKHWSEVVADHGIDFLKESAESDQPFFMYLAFNAAHDPRQAPKEYVDRYPLERIKLPENMLPEYPHAAAICGKRLRDERLCPYPRTEYSVKVNRQEYFALITHMDDQIGRILKALEETGQADSTYIVFTADHGLACGHHGLLGKQNMYDHSVRVPFMVVGPDVKAGSQNKEPIYLQDIVPTTLELAGCSIPEHVEFKSLLPMLRGEAYQGRDAIYGAYMRKQRMITKDGWKLIYYPTIGVNRLFKLNADPLEQRDLASNPEYAPKISELRGELEKLSIALKDPLDYSDPVKSGKKNGNDKKKKKTKA